jgi:hypothetical protein
MKRADARHPPSLSDRWAACGCSRRSFAVATFRLSPVDIFLALTACRHRHRDAEKY